MCRVTLTTFTKCHHSSISILYCPSISPTTLLTYCNKPDYFLHTKTHLRHLWTRIEKELKTLAKCHNEPKHKYTSGGLYEKRVWDQKCGGSMMPCREENEDTKQLLEVEYEYGVDGKMVGRKVFVDGVDQGGVFSAAVMGK